MKQNRVFLFHHLLNLPSIHCQMTAPASIEKAGVCPNQSRFWDVSSIFPNLQSLELSVRTSFLTGVEIPFLPRTLTELNLSIYKWPNPSLLPPKLEILSFPTISYEKLTAPKIADLPRSLRISNASLNINSDTEWALLPPALEKARFNEVVLSATNMPYLQALPLKHLDTLKLTLVDSLNAPWISQLPSTLTYLDLSKSEFPISSTVIKSLPRGINTLRLKRIVGEDIEEGQNLFPPNLTSLLLSELSQTRKMCDILIKCLPQTLKSLSTRSVGENMKSLELLPPSVTYCDIFSYSASSAPIITLPQGLPSLELAKSLPHTLTELDILIPVQAEILDLLPSGLQILSLKIEGEVNPTDFGRMAVLKSLTIRSFEIDVKYFRGTFPASLRTLWIDKVVEHTKMSELPGSLQWLTIEIDAELTNEIIQQLPRSLRSLRLKVPGWSRVTDDGMQRLPPHMAPEDIFIQNNLEWDRSRQFLRPSSLYT